MRHGASRDRSRSRRFSFHLFIEKPREFIEFYRNFRKFLNSERGGSLRHHTRNFPPTPDRKCGKLRTCESSTPTMQVGLTLKRGSRVSVSRSFRSRTIQRNSRDRSRPVLAALLTRKRELPAASASTELHPAVNSPNLSATRSRPSRRASESGGRSPRRPPAGRRR